MAKIILTKEQILQEARNSWPGKTGEERASKIKALLEDRLPVYAKYSCLTEEEVLQAWEKSRRVNCVNFYQEHKIKPIGEELLTFDTIAAFKERFPSGRSICPSCEKESTDFYECSQPDCDWKVYGLFGHMGKGVSVLVKERFLDCPFPVNLFKPIELANDEKEQ